LFLAHLPPNQTRQHLLLEGGSAEDRTLQAQLAEIRASGVSRIRDAVLMGMSGLSAPVFDHDGNIHCALTLVFQSVLMDRADSLAQDLKLAAACLSMRLGFNDQTKETKAEKQKGTSSRSSSRTAREP
jgi:DNA-binding IclR family transcriptional regulator